MYLRYGNAIKAFALPLVDLTSRESKLPDGLRNKPARGLTRSEFHNHVFPVLAAMASFNEYLEPGVQRELIDLCRLDALNGQRARILYNAKIDTVAVLANSSASDVENVLVNAMPFESRKAGDGETEREANRR